MKLSIITVCFNSQATIRQAVESVLSQVGVDIEYIIVDGGSTDETLSILSDYRDSIAKLISEPDKGIYDAMNKGIALATGDIVGLLNSDDFYRSEHSLSCMLSGFSESPEVDMVFGDVVFVAENDCSRVTRFYSSRRFRPWKMRFGWMPPHPATFVKREIYQSFGFYSLAYKISSDFEIFVRWLLINKIPYRRVDQVFVCMREGGVSTSGVSNSIRLNREIVAACRANGIYTNMLMVMSKVPMKLLELIRRPTHG